MLLINEPFLYVPREYFHTKLQVYRFDDKGLESFITDIQVIKQRAGGGDSLVLSCPLVWNMKKQDAAVLDP